MPLPLFKDHLSTKDCFLSAEELVSLINRYEQDICLLGAEVFPEVHIKDDCLTEFSN